MNKEELEVAGRLNALENIRWWFRNPEISGFYIQGWLKNKFYPDFIAKTKSGKYILLEYKGEHIATGEDSDYKKAIGEQWEKLGGGNYRFEWVEKNNIDSVINKISRL